MRSFLGLLVGVAIGVAAFWAYMTYTIKTPDDAGWIAINSRLPGPMRAWSCGQVKARLSPTGAPPAGCEDHWK